MSERDDAIRTILNRLLCRVNAVTVWHRHGNKVPDNKLSELNESQSETEEALAALDKLAVEPSEEHVAWLRYITVDGDIVMIEACSSCDYGAFKVYRQPQNLHVRDERIRAEARDATLSEVYEEIRQACETAVEVGDNPRFINGLYKALQLIPSAAILSPKEAHDERN